MVVSFSVKKLDKKNIDLIEDIKITCIGNGINFSYVVLEALAKYKKEVLDERTDLKKWRY